MRPSEKWFAVGMLVIACLLLGSCVRWHWNECRQVGHGVLYCIYDLSRD